MELNLSELDNVNTMNPYDSFDYNSYEKQNGENYWENPKTQETQIKKKKVSFNDILSNMNLVVNNQGVLQFMAPNQEQRYNQPVFHNNNYNNNYNNTNNNYNYNYNYNYNSNEFSQTNIRQQPKNKNSEQIDPAVKHSYIYNKYFKDYASSNVEKPEVRVPKTKEEYYQMLLDDRKKAIEQKLRVEQIKSKKLMFTVTPDSTGVNPRNIVPTKNNLRSMNFH
jgi:hypothetical protein